MEALRLEWVECPLLSADGDVLDPPSSSDDDDSPVDLNRREGHCAAVLYARAESPTAAAADGLSYVLVCGGYSNGCVSACPLIAPTALLPALRWTRLAPVAEFECDGASLTTVVSGLEPIEAMRSCESDRSRPVPATTAAPTAYLFGGLDADMNRCNTLFAVTLHTGTTTNGDAAVHVRVCEVPCTGCVPAPCARHGAGGHAGRLYVFGGETDAAGQSNGVHVCDVHTGVWRALAAPLSPAPRLLSASLLFVSPTAFVLYGGCHFVQGDVQSFADVWGFDVDAAVWTALSSESAPLPPSNGHAGGVWLLPQPAPFAAVAAFLGGKNISEGDDAVKLVGWRAGATPRIAMVCAAEGSGRGGPHWRYTPAVVHTDRGLLLLAGQCRHPQTPSSFLLTAA